MQYIVYVINTNEILKCVCHIFSTPHCIVPRASRGNLSQGQELVLPLLLPADRGEQVFLGREVRWLSLSAGPGQRWAAMDKEQDVALLSAPQVWKRKKVGPWPPAPGNGPWGRWSGGIWSRKGTVAQGLSKSLCCIWESSRGPPPDVYVFWTKKNKQYTK